MWHDFDRQLRQGMMLTLLVSLVAILPFLGWELFCQWPSPPEEIALCHVPNISFIKLARFMLLMPRLLVMATGENNYVLCLRNSSFAAFMLLSILYFWQIRKK
jgi:uncharacterized membrane protein